MATYVFYAELVCTICNVTYKVVSVMLVNDDPIYVYVFFLTISSLVHAISYQEIVDGYQGWRNIAYNVIEFVN